MTSCLKKCSCIPQRWIIAAMGFFAFFNTYTLRICLSMAITKMAVALNKTDESLNETCPEYYEHVSNNTSIISGGTFEWSEYVQGIILSSFYWGYTITHFPGGFLARKFGAKNTIGVGLLITAILTIITPAATLWGDADALIAVRFLMGLCEGVIQPGMSCLLAQWLPPQERSIISAYVYTGVKFGILISSIVSGQIIGNSSDNWPLIFYCFGGIGVMWYVFWYFLCYNSPKEHPFITEREKLYLHEHMSSHTHDKSPPFPWKHALTSRPFLALVIMQCGQDWSNYTIMSDLPKYMNSVLRLPVHLNGYASSMHNVSSWVFSMVMSWLSDRVIVQGYVSRTNVRKGNAVIASVGPAVMLLLAMYAGCNITWAVALITIGLTLSGSSHPGLKVNVLDLSPNYAGILMGISNGTAAVAGILAPYAVGVLAPNQTISEWRLIFWIVAIVYCVPMLNFVISASGDVQPWNDPAFLREQKKKCDNLEEDVKLLQMNQMKIPKQ